MIFDTRYFSASGITVQNYRFLGSRFEQGKNGSTDPQECWVMRAYTNKKGSSMLGMSFGIDENFSGLWLSDSNIAYVASDDGRILHLFVDPEEFETYDVCSSVEGIWGLDDKNVYAWGYNVDDFDSLDVLFHWNGEEWDEIDPPGFCIISMHGISTDCIYATGADQIARWDGTQWHHFKMPVKGEFASVFVAAEQEIYAVSFQNHLLQSDGNTWKVVAQGPGYGVKPLQPLMAVAKWKDRIWIGGGVNGLLSWDKVSDRLEVVKANIPATSLDARGCLLISCPGVIAHTEDGTNFIGQSMGSLLERRSGKGLNEI